MSEQFKYCGLGRGVKRGENSSLGNALSESHSMDFDDEGQNVNVECICDREKMTLFCKTCAYVGYGRLKIPCRVHPRNQMLMDMVCCPSCRTSISNMQEFNTNEKLSVQTNNPSMETEEDYPLNPYTDAIPELENKPLYGFGRGISPLKRSSQLYPLGSSSQPLSSQTFTPGMSPLKRVGQFSSVFQRLKFPSGTEVRRPGCFREY